VKNNKKWFGWLLIVMMIFALTACQPAEAVYEGADGEIAPTAEIASDLGTEDQMAVDVNDLIEPETSPAEPIVWEDATTTESGLQYIEVTAGEGDSPEDGDMVSMHFVATLPDGTMLADSRAMGQPAVAILGREQLLPGWEEGVKLMKAGGQMQMLLPPELAFGSEGNGMIPANSQIILDVELLSV
jgi:peptidylprolyl isomerase